MSDDRRTQQATLGCGTFILIALIVLFFSRPGLRDLEREVQGLRSDVKEMKKTLDTQTEQIKLLQGKGEKPKEKE